MAILEDVREAAQKRLLFLPHAIRQMSRPQRMITQSEVGIVVTKGELIGGRKGDKSNSGFPAEVGGSIGSYQTTEGFLVGLEISTGPWQLDSIGRVASLKPEKTGRSPLETARWQINHRTQVLA